MGNNKMKEMKPCNCRLCGGNDIYLNVVKSRFAFVCGIGCNNHKCNNIYIIKTAFTASAAKRKAVEAWNKENDTERNI